jgi:hypothetical protein
VLSPLLLVQLATLVTIGADCSSKYLQVLQFCHHRRRMTI